jgi:hypothetical protein
MHQSEKRLVPRIAVPQFRPDTLTLIANGHSYKLDGLKDISESGIRCELSASLPVSASVAIQYKDSKVQLAVHGRVAWCKKTQDTEQPEGAPDRFLMGVELLSPMILFAVLPQGRVGT